MGKWYNEDVGGRSYETSPSLPSSDDDSEEHDRSGGNARKRKRVKTEHSQYLGGSSSGGLTAAEAARARWGNPVGAAPAATTSKPPAPAPTPAPREAAASASAARPTRHRRPQPPTDHIGRVRTNPPRWRKKIFKALDELIGKHENPPGSVYAVLHSFAEGYKGGNGPAFDLLGVFGSFEDANAKAMEHVWQHYSEYLDRCLNLTPQKRPYIEYGVMYWYIDSNHGTLTFEGIDSKWGDFKVWVEKREIETYAT